MRYLKLTINSISHFAVDFACFFVLYKSVSLSFSAEIVGILFLIYNIIAFGTQFIFGFLGDEKPRIPLGAIGVLLVLLGVFPFFPPIISLILVALGNSIFHVGGGIDTLKESKGKYFNSGVFVSFGAIGVFLGSKFYNVISFYAVIAILALMFILEIATRFIKVKSDIPTIKYNKIAGVKGVVILLLIAIVIRSFGGSVLSKPIETKEFFVYLSLSAVFLGKFLGGLIADLVGAKNLSVAAIFLTLLLSLFYRSEIIYLLIIFLFNLVMPITLYALYSAFPKNAGLSFGLSTFALLFGIIPVYFVKFTLSVSNGVFIAVSIISLIAFVITLKNNKKGENLC